MCVCVCLFFCLFCLLLFSSDLGQSIFYTTACLLPFLTDDILSTLPYTMISTLATFPPFLHKDIIEYLSTSFLPMAICEYNYVNKCEKSDLMNLKNPILVKYIKTFLFPTKKNLFPSFPVGSTRKEGGVPAYVNLSASSMLMIAMQYTSNPGTSLWSQSLPVLEFNVNFLQLSVDTDLFLFLVYHCQLLECLMKHKQEVWKVHLLYIFNPVKPSSSHKFYYFFSN